MRTGVNRMVINAMSTHEVAEAKAGEMEALSGEEEHVREHGNARILTSGMDQKK